MAYRQVHPGGAAASLSLLDPGVSVLRDVYHRWMELDITQVGSIIAIASTLPTVWRCARRIWQETYGWIRQLFLASITIPGGDPINKSVMNWIQTSRPRHYQSFTGRTDVRRASTDPGHALKKTRHAVQYFPHWDSRWIWIDGSLIIVTRALDGFRANLSDPNSDGIGGEELVISTFGWSVEPVRDFIEVCKEHSERQTQFFVIIYARDRYGLAWKPKARKPIRLLETVHIDHEAKRELITDIRNFLAPRSQMLYQSRSMPYRRGYLFYGPPGTGKSSLSVAIAGEFGLDLYEVKIPSVATDADLEQMFLEIPPRCVVLLEDIDAVWVERKRAHNDTKETGQQQVNCTLSGLLNVLDGVGSQEGRIVIMTTNQPESLDDALIRPGRVDKKLYLGNISRECAQDMFIRMFSSDQGCGLEYDRDEIQTLAKQFASHIPEDVFTPSLLQGFFQSHLESPHQAASSISDWVTRELSTSRDKEFEVVLSQQEM